MLAQRLTPKYYLGYSSRLVGMWFSDVLVTHAQPLSLVMQTEVKVLDQSLVDQDLMAMKVSWPVGTLGSRSTLVGWPDLILILVTGESALCLRNRKSRRISHVTQCHQHCHWKLWYHCVSSLILHPSPQLADNTLYVEQWAFSVINALASSRYAVRSGSISHTIPFQIFLSILSQS